MAKEYTKAIKIQNSFVIYKNSLSEKELKDFIDCNDIFLKEEIADDYSIVYENESIYLYEWKKYKVRALGDTLFHEEDFMGIGEYGTDTFGSLQYKNCVGSAFFRNLEITILSKKMSKKECDNMIEIVNRYISNLSYDFKQTTYSKINRNRRERKDLNYLIYLLIMYALKPFSRQENPGVNPGFLRFSHPDKDLGACRS